MKYRDLQIQTQREFPNNARTEGFGWLVRAGFLTRENELTSLGKYAVEHLKKHNEEPASRLFVFRNLEEDYFPFSTGPIEVIHCPACGYSARKELALFQKTPLPAEEPLPAEKIETPDCHTIEALASYLNILKEKTAKAMMFTRVPSGKFVFVVIRGDMALSESKLTNAVGDVRLATTEEIERAGATPGYASPIGLTDALIVVDDLIPHSTNLVAGANEAGYHLLNTNCGHDYFPEIVTDLALANAGHTCAMCGSPLEEVNALLLKDRNGFRFENILLALAESHHDDKGLTFPKSTAPFDVYLMHVPGKTMDTKAKAEEIYGEIQNAGISVLFDDRDERAGVKFNDADLIGCPVRVTVGEKNLIGGMVELKKRTGAENVLITNTKIISAIQKM
ncbi:MAG: Proline--tRNA ligase [Anaerolineales bacterium]|nr:Proline--tRNA ligase [Anaerolineales bacterium]